MYITTTLSSPAPSRVSARLVPPELGQSPDPSRQTAARDPVLPVRCSSHKAVMRTALGRLRRSQQSHSNGHSFSYRIDVGLVRLHSEDSREKQRQQQPGVHTDRDRRPAFASQRAESPSSLQPGLATFANIRYIAYSMSTGAVNQCRGAAPGTLPATTDTAAEFAAVGPEATAVLRSARAAPTRENSTERHRSSSASAHVE